VSNIGFQGTTRGWAAAERAPSCGSDRNLLQLAGDYILTSFRDHIHAESGFGYGV
jgi:hypothetical protein